MPNFITLFFAFIGLLSVLGTLDSILVHHAFRTTLTSGASVQMVFGFEVNFCIIIVSFSDMNFLFES